MRATLPGGPWWLAGMIALGIMVSPWPGPASSSGQQRLLHIEAEDFAFNPGTVTVNAGDYVTIELAASDVVHGLYVDGYDLEVTAEPGKVATLSFVADKPGTFRFRCSTTCGPLHPFMIGKLRVGSNRWFWRGVLLSVLAALTGIVGVRR